MADIKSADKEASNHGQVNKRSTQWNRVKDKENCLQTINLERREGGRSLKMAIMILGGRDRVDEKQGNE